LYIYNIGLPILYIYIYYIKNQLIFFTFYKLLILTQPLPLCQVSVHQLAVGKLFEHQQHTALVINGKLHKQDLLGWFQQVEEVYVYELQPDAHTKAEDVQALSL
jgi:hypothetical protein